MQVRVLPLTQPDPPVLGDINNDTILKQTNNGKQMSDKFKDADRLGYEECLGNPENREYLQQHGVGSSYGRPKSNPVLEAIDDAVQPENSGITTEQHNEMLDDIRAAYLLQCSVSGVDGRPKSNPVLEAIDAAKWSDEELDRLLKMSQQGINISIFVTNSQIENIRKAYLQHHPQGPEVAGRTTNYYACWNCGEPIDMTGTGLEGLSAPGDGGEFERAIATLYPDRDYHGAIHRITVAHNTDRAADKQRIAELEQLTEVLKGFLEQQTQRSDNASVAVRRLKNIAKKRIAELEAQAVELREDLVDALQDVISYASECTSSKDYAEKRLAELEAQLTLALKQRDCESERSSKMMDEIVELRYQLVSKGGAK